MTRYKKTMAEAIAEVWANDIQLDEGKMKTIATMFAGGSSPEEIAKKMKLPLSTVKSILGEEDLPESMLWEFTDAQIQKLKKEYSGLKGARISLARANQLRNIFDKITNSQLPKLYKADIPFLSSMAASRMIQKGIQIPKGIKLSTFENKSWEEITETHTSDQSSKNIQKDKNKQENAPSEADIDRLKKQGLKPTKEETMKLRNGTKVLDKVFPNMTMARNAASAYMQANKGKKADGYQSPFNNRFYVRIREEQLKEAKYTINYEVESDSNADNRYVGNKEMTVNAFSHKDAVKKYGQEVNKLVKQAQARGSKSILSVHISDMQKDGNEISDREVNQLNGYARDFIYKGVYDSYIKEYAEYIEYMCKSSSQAKQVANMFKGKIGGGELSASGSEVRVDSAKDVENIHKQVVAKFGDDVRVITKEENLEENASVMKGVDDYIKIGQDKIKNHPSFKALYAKQKRDLMKTVGPKYIKIHDTENGQKRSIHAFIDKQTGDLFKPAGVNAPAKGARGNVTNKDFMNKLKTRFDTHGGHLYARDPYARIFGSMFEQDETENGEVESGKIKLKDMMKGKDEEKKKEKEEKSKESIDALKDQVALLKQKLEIEKNKAVKPEPNPDTGEVPLSVGLAQKLLRDKEKKEVKKEEADLTKKQIKMVHKVADDLPKKSFRDRYGKEKGDSVRYGTATNMVKKKMKVENSKHPAKAMYETIKAVKNKAEKTGMPYSILKKVYDRGMAAWKGGHRPGATQQQWALARVNSFVTKSSGTWGGADKDLAKKVRGSK